MKQAADKFTGDLFGEKRRGRPPKPNAMTVTQRVRKHRARKKAALAISVSRNEKSEMVVATD